MFFFHVLLSCSSTKKKRMLSTIVLYSRSRQDHHPQRNLLLFQSNHPIAIMWILIAPVVTTVMILPIMAYPPFSYLQSQTPFQVRGRIAFDLPDAELISARAPSAGSDARGYRIHVKLPFHPAGRSSHRMVIFFMSIAGAPSCGTWFTPRDGAPWLQSLDLFLSSAHTARRHNCKIY